MVLGLQGSHMGGPQVGMEWWDLATWGEVVSVMAAERQNVTGVGDFSILLPLQQRVTCSL